MADVLEDNNPAVIPVIHYHNDKQVLDNAELAAKEAVDGVFVIDHLGSDPYAVFETQRRLKDEFPALWSGVNSLQLPIAEAFGIIASGEFPVDGIWADNAGIELGHCDEELTMANSVRRLRADNNLTDVQYFGGVAHKATPTHTEDPQVAADLAWAAMPFVDIVTTSGPGTGRAANPDKIRAMHQRLAGRLPLALASGVDISNVEQYAGQVDALLVASSIEAEDGEFDQLALQALVRRVRSLAET